MIRSLSPVWLLLVLVSTWLPVQQVCAQVPFYWEFIRVELDVQENGDLLVGETQKYVFTGPYTNERYRNIPLDKVERIDNVQVLEDGKPLAVTTEIKENQLWIRWRHALRPPESHTFVVQYRC